MRDAVPALDGVLGGLRRLLTSADPADRGVGAAREKCQVMLDTSGGARHGAFLHPV